MKRILLITAAVAALGAAPAQAAPDYSGTLDATTTSFTWEGSGSGLTDPFGEFVTCEDADVHQCDDVLLKLDAGGDLTVTIDNTSPTGVEVPDPTGEFGGNLAQFQDLDMNIYKSNAAGEPEGDSLTEDGSSTLISEAATVKNLKPGFYLVRVDYFLAAEATYTGTATLTNVVKPATVVQAVTETTTTETAPPPPPAVNPAPAAAPTTSTAARKKALAKCRAKAKKIKNAKKRKKALKRCAAKAKRA